MRSRLTLSLALIVFGLSPVPGWPIELLDTGPSKRVVRGYLVKEDDKQVTVRIKLPGGKERIEKLELARYKITHKIDQQRLEKLSTNNPKAYHDYADVLASQKSDPEAVDVAMRLYLIAAYLDPALLGRTSLQNMGALTEQPADAQKFRAMALLIDGKSDPTSFIKQSTKPLPLTYNIKNFQDVLRRFRNGDIKGAKVFAEAKGMDLFFNAAPGLGDKKKFFQICEDVQCTECKLKGTQKCSACEGKGQVADQNGMGFQNCTTCNGKRVQKCSFCEGTLLVKDNFEEYLETILRAEVWALDQLLKGDVPNQAGSSGGSWSTALKRHPLPPSPLLDLETITEYNPRHCVYRQGKWVAP